MICHHDWFIFLHEFETSESERIKPVHAWSSMDNSLGPEKTECNLSICVDHQTASVPHVDFSCEKGPSYHSLGCVISTNFSSISFSQCLPCLFDYELRLGQLGSCKHWNLLLPTHAPTHALNTETPYTQAPLSTRFFCWPQAGWHLS